MRHLARCHDFNARFLEAARQLLGYISVLDWYDVGHVLNNGHIRADGVIEVGKFDTDGTGTHHDELLRLLFHGHGFTIANDFFSVLGQVGQFSASGAGGDNHVVGFNHLLRAV